MLKKETTNARKTELRVNVDLFIIGVSNQLT